MTSTDLHNELGNYRRFFVDGPVVVFRWIATTGWPVEYVSPNVAQLFDVSAQDFQTGRVPYASCVHPDDLARVVAEVQHHSDAGVAGFDQEYRIVRPDGAVRWLFDHTLVARDEAGTITHYEGYVIDVTNHKQAQLARERMEKRLMQAQKLESLGVLAGGIAHDFNNLLTGVLGNASLGLRQLEPDHPACETLLEIVRAAELAADLTRQMLAYAGRCSIERRPIDLSTHVRSITRLLESTLLGRVRLELLLGNDLPLIEADPAQIQQVVMNLVINGAEACGERSGKVTVATYAREQARTDRAEACRWVVLEVRDDGAGMDELTRQRIFEPFFSTKFQGRGLGLSAVLGIIRAHDGQIHVSSAPGEGSNFLVEFPARSGSLPAPAPAAPHEDVAGKGLVLVVDDEPVVLQLACRVLQLSGHEVISAGDGRRALELFHARKDEIDAVLLDRTMPELGGAETLAAMRAIDPGVVVVLTSGYDEAETRGAMDATVPDAFLQKPFDMDTLVRVIASALQIRAGTRRARPLRQRS